MQSLGKTILILGLVFFISGCTIHLKATELEASGGVSGVYKIDHWSFSEREELWR